MITIPTYVNAQWIAALDDKQLVAAEAKLYTDFRAHEVAERSRSGSRYVLLEGPAVLVTAWHQWLLVSNATRARGLPIRRSNR